MSDHVYYLNLSWDVEPLANGHFRLTLAGEAPEHLEGRALEVRLVDVPAQKVVPEDGSPPYVIEAHPSAEVWECSRDGQGRPLERIGNSPRLVKVLPQGATGRRGR